MTSEPDFSGGDDHPFLEVVADTDDDSLLIVSIRGELDLATGPTLRQRLQSVSGRRRLVFRLSDLEFIDACGLNALLTCWDGADTIAIEEPSQPVRRLLGLVGMESMIHDQRPQKTP